MSKILTELLTNNGLTQLKSAIESDSAFFLESMHTDAANLFDLSSFNSVDKVLSVWPDLVGAYLPGPADEVNSHKITAAQAKESFAQGHSLFFDDAQILSEKLQEALFSLIQDLQFCPLSFGRCLMYATPEGNGTDAHFDQNLNLVLHLKGEKTWWLAKNESVSNPLVRHTLGTPADPELQSYIESDLPAAMPENKQRYDLRPGSFLLVPAGYWHETKASTDSLSLNFTFTVPAKLDLILAELRSGLVSSPQMRERLMGKNLDAVSADLKELAQIALDKLI